MTTEEPTLLTRAAASWRRSTPAQTVTYMLVDATIVSAATIGAYFARFEAAVPPNWASDVWLLIIGASVVFIALFWVFRLYHFVWRYVGVDLIVRTAVACAAGGAILLVADLLIERGAGARYVPLSIPPMVAAFTFIGVSAVRSIGRLQVLMTSGTRGKGSKILIAGAGDAGSLLLRDIENQPDLGFRVVGFIDDDPSKWSRLIRGVRVLGGVDAISAVVEREAIDEVFVAMPSASVAERRRVLDACNAADIPIRIVPGIARDRGALGVSDLRAVSIEDLLGREPVDVDLEAIGRTLTGKVVAVTGAAGSIGSELCRQIMLMKPRRLHLLEIDETRLYEVYLELRELDPDVPQMHICDIRNEEKTGKILGEAGADIVFHAAAYKHVPLMELAPDEAVKMNVGGTLGILNACVDVGIGHFVFISTDKAVNASSVMGATKALAERLTFAFSQEGLKTTAVRFGNVLGSRGSVVPLFERQLRNGGPVLVTHPEVTRYFMTIPEAARLVLQAQALSEGGELFVLDMGTPVRIVDLARKMIALSGSSAEIRYQGLRPGEKMHEVLVHDDHELLPTGAEKVLRLNALPRVDPEFLAAAYELIENARWNRVADVIDGIASLLPDFCPSAVRETAGLVEPGALGMDAEMETLT